MAVSPISQGAAAIEQVVQRAADATGVDFGFLLRTAKRESGLRATAHAPTSSAAGLFQFIEQTWMSTLKRHGSAHGYARYAQLVEQGADGRYFVPGGEEARRTVMNLRYEPHAASVMAGELISDNAAFLRARTGREPTGGELYAAHFLGPQGSARLIQATQTNPSGAAANLFPDAAGSNRSIFYREGRPVTVAELYNNLGAFSAGGRGGGGSGAVAGGARGVAIADPGEGAFMQYAGAGRLERLRLQEMVVQFLLSDGGPEMPGGDAKPAASPVQSMFSAEMLTLLSQAKTGAGASSAGR